MHFRRHRSSSNSLDVYKRQEVDCISEDGAVMGISQKEHMLYGVQFHPEAVLTEYGHELLENFCKIAEGREENKYVS